ncbi:uncharacterized protein [Dysidea avara]|uniref:uncharacterized protein isoform X2 n=1 Tax=Dysidea avara TaxID=196820 RepID=UPI003324CB1E
MPYVFRQSDLPKLDIQVDRGGDFEAWRAQWTSYCTLSGLAGESAATKDGGPSPHTYNDSCHVYENGICDSYLKTEGPTNLTTLHSTLISEEDVVAFFSALDTRSTPSCVAASKSFICQYVFPPCHNDGDYQLITEEQCLYVQDEACVVEWLLAKSLFPNLIPDCRLLNGASAVLDNSTVTCPDNFKLFCESCLPLCSSFSQYDKVTTSIRKIVDITAAVIAIVGGLLLIILSAMRRKTMWQFPAVFTVYTAMCPMTIAIFVIISHIDHNKDLYCSHEVLTQAIEEPTVFCNISGGVFQFCLMLMSSFWLLHLFHVYLSIVFPIRSRFLKTKKWSQRLHIAEVVGSIFISALCPAVVLATNINYNLIFYPPLLCTPATQISVFYSMTIPVVLVTVIGLNLIVTVVWTLFKGILFERLYLDHNMKK